jgi:flagellar biosynthesis protein FliQ
MLAIDSLIIRGLELGVFISCFPLALLFVVGLFSSVLQAATQVQEQCLSFVPKICALALILFFMGPLAINLLSSYLCASFDELPQIRAEKRLQDER